MNPDPNVVLAAMQFLLSISILGILAGFGRQWLKMRAQQRNLGASSRELEQKVEQLEQANAENAQRLENLETIVVSQTWGALQEPGLSEADRQRRVAAGGRHERPPPRAG